MNQDKYVSYLLWGTGGFCFIAIVAFIVFICTCGLPEIEKVKIDGAQGIIPLETPKGLNGPMQPPMID